ncbi:MAG: V-type ATP synthase subunit D [Promethearchaeota archaeon]
MIKISFKTIKPTKTNLIELQKKLSFAEKGVTFLEYKQEQILFHIKKHWNEYWNLRKKLLKLYEFSMFLLNENYKESGKTELKLISEMSKIQYNPSVSITPSKLIGISIPYIKLQLRGEMLPSYSFENTSHFLDLLISNLKKILKTIISVAEEEDLILKFALNYKRISRRINGLKNIIIPNLKNDIKIIKEILEELDRENFVRLKKTKDLISKAESD